MGQTAVLVWLGLAVPQAAHQAELDAWAKSHSLELTRPPQAAVEAPAYDAALATKIEALLDQANLFAGSMQKAQAAERLQKAESLLRANPELPQAAWLMAERFRLEARITTDAARQTEAQQRAFVLEGVRTEVYGRSSPTRATGARSSAPTHPAASDAFAKQRRVYRLVGILRSDEVYVDGVLAQHSTQLVPGEHHLRVLRARALVWSGWMQFGEQASIRIPAPAPEPCSDHDFLGTTLQASTLRVGPHTRCPNWVAAAPDAEGKLWIAECHATRCTAPRVLESSAVLSPPLASPRSPGGDAHPDSGWPAWATYVVTGVGVAAATGIVLWQLGAFESQPDKDPVWIYEGVNPAALRF